tara:strand:+ start:1015 stop:1416 length:402 start_codon:yes stop_codon:yes gene_type:complete
MMEICRVSTANVHLSASQELIVTWENGEENKHHTKKEYLKILTDGEYKVAYEIKWKHVESTSQPLQLTIYRITKDFQMIALHQHATVCVGNPITVRKNFPFQLKKGDRICVAAKNFSSVNFLLIDSKLSLTQL